MSIQVGENIPSVTVSTMTNEGPTQMNSDDIFNNKKVVLFAVPGAFTPTCSEAHLPGFVVNADKIKAKGVDTIACISVNDAFVMGAWGKQQNASEILMLADGNADFAKAIGMELDGTNWGMGIRSKRYAMVVDNNTVSYLGVDEAALDKSSAEAVLAAL